MLYLLILVNMRFSIILLITLFAFNLDAQESKKIIIKKNITKTVTADEKGKTTTTIAGEEDKKSDDELDQLIKSGKNGEFLTIDKNIDNGVETTLYKLTKVKDGKTEVIEWDGKGDMPEVFKNKIDKIDFEENDDDMGNKTLKVKIDKKSNEDASTRKGVRLNVAIIDEGNGVTVEDVIPDGPASKAGIKTNDIILKIEDDYIFSSPSLLKKLEQFKSGDKVNFLILREGKEKKMVVEF